jgi:hypothetical protein
VFREGTIKIDLSKLVTKSIIVDISDPDVGDSIANINVTVSGTVNYNINPSSPNVLVPSTSFTINYIPTREEYPVFK